MYRNPHDMYIIILCHLIQVFAIAVDRPGVHHIGAQRHNSLLAIGEYGDVSNGDVRIPNNLNRIANTSAEKSL